MPHSLEGGWVLRDPDHSGVVDGRRNRGRSCVAGHLADRLGVERTSVDGSRGPRSRASAGARSPAPGRRRSLAAHRYGETARRRGCRSRSRGRTSPLLLLVSDDPALRRLPRTDSQHTARGGHSDTIICLHANFQRVRQQRRTEGCGIPISAHPSAPGRPAWHARREHPRRGAAAGLHLRGCPAVLARAARTLAFNYVIRHHRSDVREFGGALWRRWIAEKGRD